MRKIVMMAMIIVGYVMMTSPVYAEGASTSAPLRLDSWPVLLAAACGLASTHLTAAFVHIRAPQWIKSGANLFLVALAGVLITIEVVPGHTWRDYVGEIFAGLVSSVVAHEMGITAWIRNLTVGKGIGAQVEPIVPPPTDQEIADKSDDAAF